MKVKSFICSLFAVLLITSCSSSKQQSQNAGPKLEIETRIDMGDFEGPHFKKYTTIPFKNVGTDTLYILECMPSCDCTELVLSDSVFAPGTGGTITAYLDLTDKPLRTLEQPFFILSNDPEQHQIDVILVGTKR